MTDEAPGELESLRGLLNTWSIPNDGVRAPSDALPRRKDELRGVRDELRELLGLARPAGLQGLLERYPVRPVVATDETGPALRLEPVRRSAAAAHVATAANAVHDGSWARLRACPDCRYVFYDTSRNGARTWCRMVRADGSGRSCGTLAKVRAKRERDRAADGVTPRRRATGR